ncbi:hypothetical protein PTTW11_02892 [Pyrenophora teres f. teres]|uniref:Uncharacterized protein n=1 Tax=Pyrenophora teres f. teres TaxID=97479 RepID=A0A6S6VSK9_9PLEO|nr:hypothetical protein PTNB29_01355 [Pyrenophora teres f. teres]CAE7016023.1 hypothetical protein PTTW11_02892 [Pyrenophora teres f. teres]
MRSLHVITGLLVATANLVTAGPLKRETFEGACILNNDHPAPGVCQYDPDEAVSLQVKCDTAFPCTNNNDICQYNDQDPTGTATCS